MNSLRTQGILPIALVLACFLAGCNSGSRDAATVRRPQFEHLVCHAQFDRVTFVNKAWTGDGDSKLPDIGDLDTCPYIWDFLDDKGAAGWELVSVVSRTSTDVDSEHPYLQLFLKRQTVSAAQQ